MHAKRHLPVALTLAVAFAAGCGPVKIDVGGVLVTASPKASKSPGDVTGSPEATPSASATAGSNATPTPDGTAQPNQTPTPGNGTAQASPTATPPPLPPGASPTPTPTPKPVGTTPVATGNASIKAFALDGPTKPMGVGVDSQGNAWVGMGQFSTSSDPASLYKLSPTGEKLKTVEMPGYCLAVVVDKQDNAWVLHYAKAQFGGQAGAISKVSAAGEILSTQVLGGLPAQPGVLVPDPAGNLWTLEQQGKVDKISPNGGILGSYAVTGQPLSVGVDSGGFAWVGMGGEKNLLHLGATGVVQDSFKITSSGSLYVVGVDSAGGVWAGGPSTVNGASASTVAYLDLTGKELQRFDVGAWLRQLQPTADQKMWVLTSTQAGGGSVTKMTSKGESLDSYPAGDSPQAFGIGGEGSIWVTNPLIGKVTRIKPASP